MTPSLLQQAQAMARARIKQEEISNNGDLKPEVLSKNLYDYFRQGKCPILMEMIVTQRGIDNHQIPDQIAEIMVNQFRGPMYMELKIKDLLAYQLKDSTRINKDFWRCPTFQIKEPLFDQMIFLIPRSTTSFEILTQSQDPKQPRLNFRGDISRIDGLVIMSNYKGILDL